MRGKKRGKIVGRCCWAAHVVPKKMKPTTTIFRVLCSAKMTRAAIHSSDSFWYLKQTIFVFARPKELQEEDQEGFHSIPFRPIFVFNFFFFSKFNSNFPLWFETIPHDFFFLNLVFRSIQWMSSIQGTFNIWPSSSYSDFFGIFFFNFKTSKPFHSKFGNLSLSVDRIVFGVFHFSEWMEDAFRADIFFFKKIGKIQSTRCESKWRTRVHWWQVLVSSLLIHEGWRKQIQW